MTTLQPGDNGDIHEPKLGDVGANRHDQDRLALAGVIGHALASDE